MMIIKIFKINETLYNKVKISKIQYKKKNNLKQLM